jgi:hypothetical protein
MDRPTTGELLVQDLELFDLCDANQSPTRQFHGSTLPDLIHEQVFSPVEYPVIMRLRNTPQILIG